MNSRTIQFVLVLSALCGHAFTAKAFNCGSTGAYGPLTITTNTTLDLPDDGIFHCTTIAVAGNATLTFNRNAINTPVYLLATGDAVIDGVIDVSGGNSWWPQPQVPGRGGPGGFDGGSGGGYFVGQTNGGVGLGPGGGVGHGTFGNYGNQRLVPLIGGSGGGGTSGSPGWAGSGGGGAILVASNTRIAVNGTISAFGGYGCNTPLGSGGAIRLIAPTVNGSGMVSARQTEECGIAGNPGRVRIDCEDNRAYRSLRLEGMVSRGMQMFVFPPNPPRLDIITVAGRAIPEGTNNSVLIELAVDSSTNQVVRVQARYFTNDVPVRVAVTPEHGPRGEFDAIILQSSGSPPFADVPVTITAGSVSQIHAWTR